METRQGGRHWVLIETGGNQRYIFGSNRLRHCVGASGLVAEVGKTWVPAAVRKLELAGEVEVVMTASGKALLLADSPKTGRDVIRAVTGRALSEAPGLRVTGAISEPIDPARYEAALRDAYRRHAAIRAARPDPLTRDRVFPWHRLCRESGRPAEGEEPYADGEPPVPASAGTLAKYRARGRAGAKLRELLGEDLSRVIPPHLDELHSASGWVAIAHADGNGVGGLFHAFGDHVAAAEGGGPVSLATYCQYQREVAEQLDQATREAVVSAVRALVGEYGHRVTARFLPIVVGGDDVTVVCDAALALPFVRRFAAAFQECTRNQTTLPKIVAAATGRTGLTASAGIAIVKSHHPFSNAYDLAEALARSAKRFRDADGRTLAGVDFHLVHASTRQDLADLREYLSSPGPGSDGLAANPGQRFAEDTRIARYAGPYLLGDPDELPNQLRHRSVGLLDEVTGWLAPGGWLSGAQAHALRQAADRSLEEYQRQLTLVLRHASDKERDRARELLAVTPPLGNEKVVAGDEKTSTEQPPRFLRLFDALCLRGLRLDAPDESIVLEPSPEGGTS